MREPVEDNDEEGLGAEILETLGVHTARGGGDEATRARRRREEAAFYGTGPPDDAWQRQSGYQQRVLLPDWVRKNDPRAFENRPWDPDQGYLVDPSKGDDHGGHPDDNRADRLLGGLGPRSQNLDGVFRLNDINDPEMRQALAYKAAMGGDKLPPQVVVSLCRRFNQAEDRAIQHETRLFRQQSRYLVPSYAARRLSRNANRRVLRVFDVSTRVRDTARAMSFFASQPNAIDGLTKTIRTAETNRRKQYGDFLCDILARVKAGKAGSKAKPSPTGLADPLRARIPALDPQIGQSFREGIASISASLGTPPPRPGPREPWFGFRSRGEAPSVSAAASATDAGGFPALDIPVFSRAWWIISSNKQDLSRGFHASQAVGVADGGDDDDDDDDDIMDEYESILDPDQVAAKTTQQETPASSSYFERGNQDFLASRMGLHKNKQQKQAERDAIQFFHRRFGLDFTADSGAKRDPKTMAIHHANLPLVLEPYTVSTDGDRTSVIQLAEGHLGSASGPPNGSDPLGNGLRVYVREESGHTPTAARTSVSEAGWMVRNNSKDDIALTSVKRMQMSAKSGRQAVPTLVMPRGGMLATGFWVLERPDATPVLLRFQSARVPAVTARKLPNGNGIRHVITSRWDIYDMAHDSANRPNRAVGQGTSILKIDWPRGKKKTETCRTMVTIHH